MNQSILSVKNSTKLYGKHEVFRNLNLEIQRGKVTVICGPSGCGKTTLLMNMALLEPISEGSISYNKHRVVSGKTLLNEKVIRKDLGIVFQDFFLWDNKKVVENITEALIYTRKNNREIAQSKAQRVARELHINQQMLDKYPPELSRGQRQRVAIARTLVLEPKIILLDEPTASLDEALIDQLVETIKVLKKLDKTVVIVTHDMRFANMVGDITFEFKDLIQH